MPVDYALENNVATVTLNRPEAMNSLDPESLLALEDIFNTIRTDDAVRAVILTGAGDRAFCTGSDLKKTMPPKESFAQLTYGQSSGEIIKMACDKPLIAALNGYTVGGGLEMALRCDIRIAVDSAKFGLPEVKIGSIPGAGGTQRLPRLVGEAHALRLLMTGDMIDAAEALRIGLITEVVAPEDLLPKARAMADQIAANAPLAVNAVKRLAREGLDMPLDQALASERMAWGVLRDTEDRIEGRVAFQEKRKPVYRGR